MSQSDTFKTTDSSTQSASGVSPQPEKPPEVVYRQQPSDISSRISQDSQSSSGSSFSAKDGVSIAASLIPLVALFKGSGGGKSQRRTQPSQRQRSQPVGSTGLSQNAKIAIIGSAALLIIGLGIVAMRK